MRLFVAIDISAVIRERIAHFSAQMQKLAPDVRWVSAESFHITLQFLGETKKAEAIPEALRKVKSMSMPLAFRGTGFFPGSKSPRVFWIGIEADERLQALAHSISHALQSLGLERDPGPFRPHLTLARRGSGKPHAVAGETFSQGLQNVRIHLEAMPALDFGTMTAHEFCLYESKLSTGGPQYSKLARFPLE